MRAALVVLFLLAGGIGLSDTAAAQIDCGNKTFAQRSCGSDPNCRIEANCFDARLRDCTDWKCIGEAALGGAMRFLSAIAIGFSTVVGAGITSIWTYVLQPAGAAVAAGFVGIGTSLGELLGSIGEGVREGFRNMWTVALARLTEALGPAAPIVAVAMVLVIVGMLLWAFTKLFDRGDDPLPGPIERLNKDSDREREDTG